MPSRWPPTWWPPPARSRRSSARAVTSWAHTRIWGRPLALMFLLREVVLYAAPAAALSPYRRTRRSLPLTPRPPLPPPGQRGPGGEGANDQDPLTHLARVGTVVM